MLTRLALAFALLAALLTGCANDAAAPSADADGGGATDGGGGAVADCGALADEVTAELSQVVEEISAADVEDLSNPQAVIPEGTQERLDDIERRVQESNCDDQMDDLLAERADDIQGEGFAADAVREALRSGGDFPF